MATASLESRTVTELYAESFPRSRARYEEARTVFPGGVTHDLRYLEPFPIYIERAQGAHKWDLDGNRLIDYWAGHGSLLLGHSHPAVRWPWPLIPAPATSWRLNGETG
jgi:glutamate-1-semialdehyde 2,1-aminomutase